MARKAKTDSEIPKTDPVSTPESVDSASDIVAETGNRTDAPVAQFGPESAAGGSAKDRQPDPESARDVGSNTVDPFEQPKPGAGQAMPPAQAVEPPPAPTPPEPPARRRSVWPMLLAGAITAALGFAAAFVLTRGDGPLADPRLPALEARLGAMDTRLAATETVASGALSPAALEPVTKRLAALEQGLDKGLEQAAAARDALSKAIEEVRQRPAETDPAAVAAYERELKAMREMLDAELTKIRDAAAKAAEAKTDAVAAGATAASLAALAGIDAALDTGADFAEQLDQLASLSPDLPVAPLRDFSTGVEPLSALQRDFPDAARAAIDADIRSGAGEGGIGGFLKAQLGLRSLSPRDGDSADAMLSRAEARLQDGDLAAALDEVKAMDGPAAEAMAAWRARAERRLAALAAFAALDEKVKN
jgi:hypothetical protein